MAAIVWILVVVAAGASSHALAVPEVCITRSIGQTIGYPIQLAKTVLAAGPIDWQVQIPDISYCHTVVGVSALVCDSEAPPEALFVNSKLLLVHRVYGFTPAYVQPTVYCQKIGPSKLSNLGSQLNLLSPNSVIQSPSKAYSQTYSSLTFPQSLLSDSLSLSSLRDSTNSLFGRPLQSVSDQRLPEAKADPLTTGLNRLSNPKLTPLYSKSDLSVLDQELHLDSLFGQSSQSNLGLSALPKLSVTPLLGSSQLVHGQPTGPQLSLSSLLTQSPSSLLSQLGAPSVLDSSGKSALPRATASPLLNPSQKSLTTSLFGF